MQHRFASHCLEKLFIQAAPVVTEELLHPPDPKDVSNGDVYVTTENLFVYAINELEGNLGFLMTDRFASHVLRVLLLVLAGEPLSQQSTRNLLQSKKKEHITVNGSARSKETSSEKRTVPDSFSEALQKNIDASIVGLDTNSLRSLATHPNGNPTLQLLLRLELTHLGKQRAKDERSIIRTLLPDDPITAESDSASFINNTVYDPVGSHLIETIVEYAPGKLFKNLYQTLFRERLPSHARNEIAGFVVCKILDRLSQKDLLEAHEALLPSIPQLVERDRLILIRTLIERCTVRDIDTQALAVALDAAYSGPEGFDIKKLVKLEHLPETDGDGAPDGEHPHNVNGQAGRNNRTAAILSQEKQPLKVHCNVLAQVMLLVPGSLSALILDAVVGLQPKYLLQMAKDPIATRTLQAALTTKNASIISTRKLVQHFYGNIADMALDKSASHVVDCIWEGTHGLAFIRERIAEELAENEAAMRDSPCGRSVWRNWKMDMYKRRRADWVKQSKMKASNDGFQSFSELDKRGGSMEQEAPKKTALQLARERHVAEKAKKEKAGQARSERENNAAAV